jgi:hypothetical protein
VEVRRIFIGSKEAEKYGRVVDAELFAKQMGIGLDYRKLFEKRDIAALDNELASYVQMARDKGILLTPVLAVNGEVVSVGRVMGREELERFMERWAKAGEI